MKKLLFLALVVGLVATTWAGSSFNNNDVSPFPGRPGAFAPGDIIWTMQACPPLPDTDAQCVGVEYVNGKFYVTSGNSNVDPNIVYVYDSVGRYLRYWLQPSGSTGWGGRDLCWDGNKLYHGDGAASTVYMCDTLGNYLTRRITGPSAPVRALAFDPATRTLWTANFSSSIWNFDTTGTVISTTANTYAIYGMAWDTRSSGGPWLWCFAQNGTPAQTVYQFNPRTRAYTGVSYLIPGNTGSVAGGACFTEDWHPTGKYGLFLLSQTTPYDSVKAMELGDYSGVESPEPVTRQGGLSLAVSPNPARGGTSVAFSLPVKGETSLKVYDAQGRLVQTLVSGTREAGTHRASLGGLSAGVYFLNLQAGTYRSTKSLVVIR